MSRVRCYYSVGVLDGVAYTQHFKNDEYAHNGISQAMLLSVSREGAYGNTAASKRHFALSLSQSSSWYH